MAITWHVQRDKSEASTPPTVNAQTPIEGGIIVRLDTDTDMVDYCYYIAVRGDVGASGQYTEKWRVQNIFRNQPLSPAFDVAVTVASNRTDVVLLPPTGAGTGSTQDIEIESPDPTDVEILSTVRSGDDFIGASVEARFRTVTRDAFNLSVPVSIEAEF